MISIIIPTFNESKNIEELIKRIAQVLKNKKFEIIIVDKFSKDGTKNIVKKLCDIYSVKFLNFTINLCKKGL